MVELKLFQILSEHSLLVFEPNLSTQITVRRIRFKR